VTTLAYSPRSNGSGGNNSNNSSASTSHGGPARGGRPKSTGYRSGEANAQGGGAGGLAASQQEAAMRLARSGPCARFNTRDCYCHINANTTGSNPNSNNNSPRDASAVANNNNKPSSRSNSRKNSANNNNNNDGSPRKPTNTINGQSREILSVSGGNVIALSDSNKGSRSRKNSDNSPRRTTIAGQSSDPSLLKQPLGKSGYNNNNDSSPRKERREINGQSVPLNVSGGQIGALSSSGLANANSNNFSDYTAKPRKNSLNTNNIEMSPRRGIGMNIPNNNNNNNNNNISRSNSSNNVITGTTAGGLLSNSGGSPNSSPPNNPALSVSPPIVSLSNCPRHPSTCTCYVWLGESGIPLNACSTAFRQLPFLSFNNFGGT
jgi:hypothetical protein